jgi:hypothetical protein
MLGAVRWAAARSLEKTPNSAFSRRPFHRGKAISTRGRTDRLTPSQENFVVPPCEPVAATDFERVETAADFGAVF